MSKFIVITKKEFLKGVLYILLISIFIYMLSLIIFKEKPTFNLLLNQHNDIIRDFDGDGILDTLSITINDKFYNVKINTNNGEYLLSSLTNNADLIDVSTSNDIKFDFIDLSRDSIPEIIITGTKDSKPSTYVFHWYKDNFTESFYTSKNIFGIIDSKNNKSPILLHTSSDKGDENTEGVMFNNNIIKDITFSKPKIPSLGVTQKFIDLVQLTYELTETPGIFTPFIPSSELGLLWNLDKNTFRYSFLNGYFKDVEWNSLGQPSSLIWVLSFDKVNTIVSNSPSDELVLYVKVTIDEFGEYKISSIKR